MQSIRNAIGRITHPSGSTAANTKTTTDYSYKVEVLIQDLVIDRMPSKHLSRNKFEPFVGFRLNDESKSAHNTFTKKDWAGTSGSIAYNETFNIGADAGDRFVVTLFNAAPILRPSQAVADGTIIVNDLLTGINTVGVAVGSLLSTRDLDLPLTEIPEAPHQGGLVSKLHRGSTAAAAEPVATAPIGTPIVLGRVRLRLQTYAGAIGTTTQTGIAPTDATTVTDPTLQQQGVAAPVDTTTNKSSLPAGGIAAGLGAGLAGLGVGSLLGRKSNTAATSTAQQPTTSTVTGANTAPMPAAGQTGTNFQNFDFQLGTLSIDYTLLERVFNIKPTLISSASRIAPFILVRRNSIDNTDYITSKTATFDQAANVYVFNDTLRVAADPTDVLYVTLLDSNLLAPNTVLGWTQLNVADLGNTPNVSQTLSFNGWDPAFKGPGLPTTNTLGVIGTLNVVINNAGAAPVIVPRPTTDVAHPGIATAVDEQSIPAQTQPQAAQTSTGGMGLASKLGLGAGVAGLAGLGGYGLARSTAPPANTLGATTTQQPVTAVDPAASIGTQPITAADTTTTNTFDQQQQPIDSTITDTTNTSLPITQQAQSGIVTGKAAPVSQVQSGGVGGSVTGQTFQQGDTFIGYGGDSANINRI